MKQNFLKSSENKRKLSIDERKANLMVKAKETMGRQAGIITKGNFIKYLDDYNKTLKRCHSTVGIAILNTSIIIVFGFSILVLSNFIPTIYFGIFTGLAMLLAMISVLTLLPSLIMVLKPFGK